MNRYEKLMSRLRNGERIITDGATGTECERRGVPSIEHAWSGGGALSHPDIVRTIHEDYIRCGAEIVISNSFAATRHALRDAGLEQDFEALNRRSVELVCEARDKMGRPDVLVAGGVSYWSFTGNHPALDELRSDVANQSALMKDAGADLLMLEMMVDIDRMLVTIEAAQSSALPVWVGLTCEPDVNGTMCLRNGDTLVGALSALSDTNVPMISIMHTEVKYIDTCLDVLERHWDGLVGVYAHVGKFKDGQWVFDFTISPHDYATHSARWLKQNVQIIGGCCGILPEHICALESII